MYDHNAKDGGGKAPKAERLPFIGEATEQQIEAWKKEHKLGIYQVVSENGHVSYFKNPSRHDVNAALSSNKSVLDPIEELVRSTCIGGSKEMLENDTILLGVMNAVKSKIDGMQATLVNL